MTISFRLGLYYWGLFMAMGIFLPYWPVWLADRGLSSFEISLLVAAGIGSRAIVNPLVTGYADRSGRRRSLIILLQGAATLAFLPFILADGFWPLLALSLVFYGLTGPVMPLTESITTKLARDHDLNYGRIRLWGSLAFIVTSVAGGAILDLWAAPSIYWMMLITAALTFVLGTQLPDVKSPAQPQRRSPVLDVLRQGRFRLFLLATACLQASHALYYAFGTLHWQRAGLGETLIGVYWAEGVAAEVLLFIWSAAVLKRLGPAGLLILAGMGGVLRWSVLAWTVDPLLIGLVQVFHGLTFGAAHLGAIHFIGRTVDPGLSASAFGLYAVMTMGLGTGGAVFAAGPMYAAWGGEAYFAMALLSFAGLTLSVWLNRRQKA